MTRKYGIGLDIGIGSVGFAVISRTNKEDARIEDLGVRLFDSGETNDHKARKSQERRAHRSVRRLIRRRSHRKDRVKKFLQKINLISCDKLKAWQEQNGNQNIFKVRLKGLDEKLTSEEIADCIIHICNHRGYREFYEDENTDKDAGVIKTALADFEERFKAGNYRSVADMILHDEIFKTATSFPDYHNHKENERYILIKRSYQQKELLDILNKQKEFYPQLTEQNIDFLCNKIVFAQRDFETGPGNEDDKTRKFMGFLDTLGKCMFYKDEKRAFRSAVISDIYALTNCLSQFTYVDVETGEIFLPKEAASAIVNEVLVKASATEKEIKAILKRFGIEMIKPGKLEVKATDTIKTLKILKATLEASGYSYEELIAEDQFDLENPSKLQKLCVILSENITPKRRDAALVRAGWNEKLRKEMSRKKFGGTASVCERYMIEAINAFLDGETYGNFQARRFEERDASTEERTKHKILPALTKKDDEEIVENVVVFKAINETRKVLNAIIRKYGSPEYINVEVADELGRSFKERDKLTKLNRENEKERKNIKKKLIELGLRNEGEVRPKDILRYRLWKAQGGVDLYTGTPIEENQVLNEIYEVDHIVPFSLILDDTAQNKALVSRIANQEKRQRVPRQYLADDKEFMKRVNALFSKGKISVKKYKYLTLESIYTPQAKVLLDEWKSRNINDTRFITRYIVNYLAGNLFFDSDKAKNVYAIKGAITSKMRKLWLNSKSWGNDEKDRENNLHHAADAIVIANLAPAYVEIASDNLKLQNIYKAHHKQESFEYTNYLNDAVKKMAKYYGFNEAYSRRLLQAKGRVPSLVRNLYAEVDKRLVDNALEFFQDITPERFMANVKDYYRDDQAFAESLSMPLVSYKQNKKFQGQITDDNPIAKSKRKETSIAKIDTLGNENILSANKYYCIEIYKDEQNKTALRGIRYVDLVKRNKKLYLVTPYPEDYQEHVMYLFANDYVRLFDESNHLKFEGYFRSVKALTRNQLYFRKNNNSVDESPIAITKKLVVKKYNVDILGNLGGEVKCSEPFMLLIEK